MDIVWFILVVWICMWWVKLGSLFECVVVGGVFVFCRGEISVG